MKQWRRRWAAYWHRQNPGHQRALALAVIVRDPQLSADVIWSHLEQYPECEIRYPPLPASWHELFIPREH